MDFSGDPANFSTGAAGERDGDGEEEEEEMEGRNDLGRRSLNSELVADAGEASDGASQGLQGVAAQGELHL